MNSMPMERKVRKCEEEKRKREMEEKEIKDKELMEIENESYEARTKLEEVRLEAIRTAELVAKEREWLVDRSCHPYKNLIKLQIQRSTYHHLNLREDVIPEGEWPAILRKQASGRIMEVMMDLDLTIPYQSIKSNLLEHLGHTKAKARR